MICNDANCAYFAGFCSGKDFTCLLANGTGINIVVPEYSNISDSPDFVVNTECGKLGTPSKKLEHPLFLGIMHEVEVEEIAHSFCGFKNLYEKLVSGKFVPDSFEVIARERGIELGEHVDDINFNLMTQISS